MTEEFRQLLLPFLNKDIRNVIINFEDVTSIEKPFAVFDLVSSLEHPRVLQRFELSDRLLSGKRPQAQPIQLQGDTLLAQLLWGSILADYTSTYTAILNNVDPTPVALIERLKQELADNPR